MFLKHVPYGSSQFDIFEVEGLVTLGIDTLEGNYGEAEIEKLVGFETWEGSIDLAVIAEQSGAKVGVGGEFWTVKYATWESRGIPQAVVTSGSLYVLGPDGKTIDRV